jgi:hypothetical protein
VSGPLNLAPARPIHRSSRPCELVTIGLGPRVGRWSLRARTLTSGPPRSSQLSQTRLTPLVSWDSPSSPLSGHHAAIAAPPEILASLTTGPRSTRHYLTAPCLLYIKANPSLSPPLPQRHRAMRNRRVREREGPPPWCRVCVACVVTIAGQGAPARLSMCVCVLTWHDWSSVRRQSLTGASPSSQICGAPCAAGGSIGTIVRTPYPDPSPSQFRLAFDTPENRVP